MLRQSALTGALLALASPPCLAGAGEDLSERRTAIAAFDEERDKVLDETFAPPPRAAGRAEYWVCEARDTESEPHWRPHVGLGRERRLASRDALETCAAAHQNCELSRCWAGSGTLKKH
jgi:hypothetical protein